MYIPFLRRVSSQCLSSYKIRHIPLRLLGGWGDSGGTPLLQTMNYFRHNAFLEIYALTLADGLDLGHESVKLFSMKPLQWALENRILGCLLGLAAGDAVGTTVEFKARGTFPAVTEMIGGGPFSLPLGAWTDDTSMALCLAVSLIEKGGFDAKDQIDRYLNWYRHGYLSSVGYCFDIGSTVRQALEQYAQTGNPYSGSTHPQTAGNGSIMRLAPIPIYYYPDREKILHFSGESSRTTHGTDECVDACRLFGDILYRALRGNSKEEILLTSDPDLFKAPAVQALANGNYRNKQISEIRGSGYVIQSLEAALWCFWHTENFGEAILKAVNLGEDADTTAAVCGQVAGAFYGQTGIPEHWQKSLSMGTEIARWAIQLSEKT